MEKAEETKVASSGGILSRFDIRTVSLLLVAVGLFVSAYLSYAHLANTSLICVGGEEFDCGLVQNSIYSKLFGIPIAYLGLLTYLVLGGILLFENRIAVLQDYSPVLVFGITLFAFLFSVWLVYVQAALLQAFCSWCLTHEVTMTLLFILSGLRLKRALS